MGELPRSTPGPRPTDGTSPGTVSSRPVHKGRVVELCVDTVRFPDGHEGEFEFVRHRGASAVLAFATDPGELDPEVLLLRQYRYATGGFQIEVPAGMPEGGESWEACARRELEEETGWRAREMRRMTQIFATPGFSNEVIHLFAGWSLERGVSTLDEDEFVEVLSVPFSQAVAWVGDGTIEDGKSVASILYGAHFLRSGPPE